jgi:hypothetical protein
VSRDLRVAALPFDPHDVGAHVSQHHAAVRHGTEAADFDNPYSAQRSTAQRSSPIDQSTRWTRHH